MSYSSGKWFWMMAADVEVIVEGMGRKEGYQDPKVETSRSDGWR